ncbi:MAG: hypothetical protein QNL35_05875 [Emcibacteraceae bacterium]
MHSRLFFSVAKSAELSACLVFHVTPDHTLTTPTRARALIDKTDMRRPTTATIATSATLL